MHSPSSGLLLSVIYTDPLPVPAPHSGEETDDSASLRRSNMSATSTIIISAIFFASAKCRLGKGMCSNFYLSVFSSSFFFLLVYLLLLLCTSLILIYFQLSTSHRPLSLLSVPILIISLFLIISFNKVLKFSSETLNIIMAHKIVEESQSKARAFSAI